MPQDPVDPRAPVEREATMHRMSRFRRTLIFVLVSLGLVSGGALISATVAGAASGSSETTSVRDSSSESSAEQTQDEGQDEGEDEDGRDCPEKDEAEASA